MKSAPTQGVYSAEGLILPPSAENIAMDRRTFLQGITAASLAALLRGKIVRADDHAHFDMDAALRAEAAEYQKMMQLGRKSPEQIYSGETLRLATETRLLVAGCMDGRIKAARLAKLLQRSPVQEQKQFHIACGKLPIAGTAAMKRDPAEFQHTVRVVKSIIAQLCVELETDTPEDVFAITWHCDCGACAEVARILTEQEKHSVDPDDIAVTSAEKLRSAIGLKSKVGKVGFAEDSPDVLMTAVPHRHPEVGAVVKPYDFNEDESGFPTVFAVSREFGKAHVQNEVELLLQIAGDPKKGIGERRMREHPFGIVLAGNQDQVDQLRDDWLKDILHTRRDLVRPLPFVTHKRR